MSSAWTFPVPARAGEGGGNGGWPLEELEPKVLLMLGEELRGRLGELQAGNTVRVGYGPGAPHVLRVGQAGAGQDTSWGADGW